VAAIIETGRYFSQHPGQLKRSLIIVAFDAEESGLKGSEHFVESNLLPIDNIRLMFSFDMVGMLEANKGVLLRGMASMQGGEELAALVAENHNIIIKGTGARIENRTDTAPFGRKGIPAVHVFTDTKSPYHKPEDQYHLLDYPGMATIVAYSADLISHTSALAVINASEKLEVKPDLFSAEAAPGRFSFGLACHIGPGYHQYKDQFYRANTAVSYAAGFFTRVSLGRMKMVSLQQEVLYDINRSKIEAGNFNRHSLTLPLTIQMGTPALAVPYRIYYFAGGYYRYSFGGKSGESKIDYSLFQQHEWGYLTGFAFDILRVTVGFTFFNALTNLKKDDDLVMLQSNRNFSLQYRF
jgi:aminopeptidase YwaD